MRLGSVPGLDTEHLEREGWAVLRGVVDPAVCDRARGCIDGILGPAVAEVPVDGRGQTARWPDPAGLPLLSSGGPYRTKVMHPIRDGVTAELAAALAPIFQQLYGCKRPEDLKLLQQMFVRTDALPPEDRPIADPTPGWCVGRKLPARNPPPAHGCCTLPGIWTMRSLRSIGPQGRCRCTSTACWLSQR